MSHRFDLYRSIMNGKKAVLYDFDGVLVDSEYYFYLSYNQAFKRFGHRLNQKEYWKYWTSIGTGINGEIKRHNLKLKPEDIEYIYKQRIKNYNKFIHSGRIKFIDYSYRTTLLFQKMGIKTAIASNSYEEDLENIFRINKKQINITLVGRRKGLRPKPYPDIFAYAAGFLKVEPMDCLVIEDAHKGLNAAKKIGMPCAIILNDKNRDFSFKRADIIFNSYKEFYEMTKKLKEKK